MAAFICDGHSKLSEEDRNIVSGGKQLDDIWIIKNPSGSSGLGTPKSDFTHGYAYLSFGDSCADTDTDADNLFLFMAGHRANNEGDAYWGFEFNQRAPADFSQALNPLDGSTRELDFDRQDRDLLVSGEVVNTQGEDEVNFTLLQWDSTDTSQTSLGSYVPSTPSCGPSEELTTNLNHEIEAPPWFIPVCDSTSDGPNQNQCRLASGDPTSNFKMIAPRDFMEVGIDLQAFGIAEQCFANSFIFTSRSSSSLTSSLKDVGGADFHACDANISIAKSATNELNDPHTFIVTVNKVAIGQSSPSVGTLVTVTGTPTSITPSGTPPGTCTTGSGSVLLSDGSSDLGRCEVTINSSEPGIFVVSASATVSVLDGFVSVATNGIIPNSGPATKTYVDASISIADSNDLRSATNEVGMAHTFTVTVRENDGSGGYVGSPGETINVVVTPDASALIGGTCLGVSAVTNGSGQCTVIVNSSMAGTFTINASSNISVGGFSLARDTAGNPGSDGSGPATKTFVDARISVTDDGVNRVGDAHPFTIHVEQNDGTGWSSASPVFPSSSLTNSPATSNSTGASGAMTSETCSDGTVNGSCSVTIVSDTTGTTTIRASVILSVGGVKLTRQTGSGAPNSPDAVKTWVDARISIDPAEATKEVGEAHTFTVTLEIDDGSGDGFVGATVDNVTIGLFPTTIMTSNTCALGTSGTTDTPVGACSLSIVSSSTGDFTISASTIVSVLGVEMRVSTEAQDRNSSPATMTFVDAIIGLSPDATNKVGQDHIFVVTVMEDDGSGSGMQLASGEQVEVSYTNSFGAQAQALASCTTRDGTGFLTDGNSDLGKCEVTISSTTAGQILATATSNVLVGGLSLTRTTSSTKTYVDARISVTPDGANPIGAPYTFTVLVEQNDGSGWSPVTGVFPTYALADTGLASGAETSDTCFTTGTMDGICYVTIVSPTAGATTIHSQVSFAVNGVTLSPQTDPDGVVTWVNADISIVESATNAVGEPHEFTVTVSADPSGGHPNFLSITASVDPEPNMLNVSTCGAPSEPDTYTRTCTLTVNSSEADVFIARATAEVRIKGVTLVLATGDHGGYPNATKTYVDARISVTPDGVKPVGAEHTFTILVEQHDGNGWSPVDGVFPTHILDNVGANGAMTSDACLTLGTDSNGICTVTVISSTTGTTTIHAGVSLRVGGALSRQTQTDAVATWVSATISITPNSKTNAVDDPHIFNVTVSADPSGGLPSFGPISASVNPVPNSQYDSTCLTPEPVDAYTRSCTITINSSAAHVFIASASAVVEIGGVTFNLATGGDSPNATKTYVDARISVEADGVKTVGAQHTFSILVEQNDGSGWSPVAGVAPTYGLNNASGASGAITSETCPDGTGINGECTVTVTSLTTGTTTIHAAR